MRVFFRRWIIIACWFEETDFWGSQSIKFVMVPNFELRFSLKTAEFPREKNITFYFWIHYFVLNYSNGCVKVTDSFRWFNQSKLIHDRFYFSRFFARKNAWNLLKIFMPRSTVSQADYHVQSHFQVSWWTCSEWKGFGFYVHLTSPAELQTGSLWSAHARLMVYHTWPNYLSMALLCSIAFQGLFLLFHLTSRWLK